MTTSFSQKLPSKTTNAYWLYAKRKVGIYPEYTIRGGKWLIFVSDRNVDRIWIKIKSAVENGRLGSLAKVATAKVNPGFANSTRVICVYTYDWKDEQDVKRIREELRRMGIVRKITYKTDEDTYEGKYSTTSTEKVSKYYE